MPRAHRPRAFVRRSVNTVVALLAGAVMLAAPFAQPVAEACGCRKPPIRVCSPTLTSWKHVKRVYTTDDAVTIEFSFLGILNPPCPPGVICLPCAPVVISTADFSVTPLMGGPVASAGSKPIVFSDGVLTADSIDLLPLSGLPWVPGNYAVTGTVTLVLADGTVLSSTSTTCFAIVEPTAPGSGVPIIEVVNVTPDGPGGTQVHPGDAQANTYIFTNNRPFPCTVDLTVTNDQRGGIPIVSPGPGSAVDPFSFADPGPGDDYVVAFGPNVPDPCLLLPPAPHLQTFSMDMLSGVLVAPFSSVAIPVYSRGWQLCETGSGCEQIVEATVNWTDSLSRDVCVGGITLSDSAVLPAFPCDDSGSIVVWTPTVIGNSPVLRANAQPRPGEFFLLDYLVQPPQIFIDGNPVPTQIQLDESTTDTCRITFIAQYPWSEVPLPVDFFFAIDNFTAFPAQILADDAAGFMPGVPTGFDQVAPTTKYMLLIDENMDAQPDSAVMNLVQLQGEFVCDPFDPNDPGKTLDMSNSSFSTSPGFGSDAMLFEGQTLITPCFAPTPRGGLPVGEIHFSINLRSFAGGLPAASSCPCDLDGNPGLNLDDVAFFTANFPDLNGDTVFNLDDVSVFADCFLNPGAYSCP